MLYCKIILNTYNILDNILGEDVGYFMHASTASGQKGDSAWLTTQKMSPNRKCSVQCLQFYYYNSGNKSDELNIWMREFQDEQDLWMKGTYRLLGQITGNVSLVICVILVLKSLVLKI